MDESRLSPPPMPPPDGTPEQRRYGPVSRPATAGELRAAALEIRRGGGFPLPCQVGGKRPVPIHGLKDAATDENWVRTWWDGRPYNVAETTGLPGRYDVLDVDNHGDRGTGWAAFSRLKAAGLLAGAVRLVRTPSGGLHVYFAATDQRSGSLPALHIDFKAAGGYVLTPPSQVGGRPYQLVDARPWTGAVLDWQACKALLSLPRPVRRPSQHGPGSARGLVTWLQEQGEGNRNSALFWAACRALEARDQPVLDDLAAVAIAAGLSEPEVSRTISSAIRKVTDGG